LSWHSCANSQYDVSKNHKIQR